MKKLIGLFFSLVCLPNFANNNMNLNSCVPQKCDFMVPALSVRAPGVDNVFKNVKFAAITLSNCNEYGLYQNLSLTLNTEDENGTQTQEIKELNIIHEYSNTSDCGCIRYVAYLPSDPFTRFSVGLLDTRECLCENHDAYWKATVVSGTGFCGTMDSLMELKGFHVYYEPTPIEG